MQPLWWTKINTRVSIRRKFSLRAWCEVLVILGQNGRIRSSESFKALRSPIIARKRAYSRRVERVASLSGPSCSLNWAIANSKACAASRVFNPRDCSMRPFWRLSWGHRPFTEFVKCSSSKASASDDRPWLWRILTTAEHNSGTKEVVAWRISSTRDSIFGAVYATLSSRESSNCVSTPIAGCLAISLLRFGFEGKMLESFWNPNLAAWMVHRS